MTDQKLEAQIHSIEGALRGLQEGSCLCQYTRPMSGFDLPRKEQYANSVTQVFVNDRLSFLEKTAALLEGHLSRSIGLRLLDKNAAYQFFSYLFNLEEWAAQDTLFADDGVDRQIAQSPVAWHSDHLTIGRRYVQMFSLRTTRV
ncbi:MAG: hypothetical protein P4L10_16240 [Acidobacteriaceae bacterium]|nr:hypothetical protein [Acidobacteriaceae bacterium]